MSNDIPDEPIENMIARNMDKLRNLFRKDLMTHWAIEYEDKTDFVLATRANNPKEAEDIWRKCHEVFFVPILVRQTTLEETERLNAQGIMTNEFKEWVWKTSDPRPDNIPSWEQWDFEPAVEFWAKSIFHEIEKLVKGHIETDEAIRLIKRKWFNLD